MKSIIRIAVLFIAVLLLSSCVRNELDGKCSNPPRFSARTLDFSASGGTGTITSNERFWDIRAVAIDDCQWETPHGSYLSWIPLGCFEIGEGDCWLTVCCDTIRRPDSSQDFFRARRLESTWFSMDIKEDEESKYLVFVVKPNDTGKDRKLMIDIFAGNCFLPYLVISQSAE